MFAIKHTDLRGKVHIIEYKTRELAEAALKVMKKRYKLSNGEVVDIG